jgi:hypothetical protein
LGDIASPVHNQTNNRPFDLHQRHLQWQAKERNATNTRRPDRRLADFPQHTNR